jgi:hypothetical protein
MAGNGGNMGLAPGDVGPIPVMTSALSVRGCPGRGTCERWSDGESTIEEA